ncbi:hypothetical protein Ciccas_010018, partial [Cichlidogyrus casuarinus]
MDAKKICEALQMSLTPDPEKKGEKMLKEMHKVAGFTPLLLKITLEESVPPEVRHASVLYLKNEVKSFWAIHEEDSISSHKENESDSYFIHEDDKIIIRQNIVKAIITTPTPLQSQLQQALGTIIQNDYPEKYGYFFELLKEPLLSTEYAALNGALLALLSFFQRFRYSQRDNWMHADRALAAIFPVLTDIMTRLLPQKNIESYTLQKAIFKSLYVVTSFHLNPDTFNKEVTPVWVNIVCTVLQDINPEFDSDSEGIYWKNKKWAINLMLGVFERFGNPGSVQKVYQQYSTYFFDTFSAQLTNQFMSMLLSEAYLSPRVKATCISFFIAALEKSQTWKIMKPHFGKLLSNVLHPLLCHSDDDEELWEEDPNEYIRFRCVDIDSSQNPCMTAFALLESASSKRKGILQMVMEFCMVGLNSTHASDKDKDGVLHIIGAISETLLKRKGYSDQLENFLVNFVFPTLQSPLRYRRARACWLMSRLSNARFHNNVILCRAIDAVRELMMNDVEKPVQVMAAQALVQVCEDQEKAQDVLKPHLSKILFKLIDLLRDTAFDEINEMICTLISIYCEDIVPIALSLILHLVGVVVGYVSKAETTDEDDDNYKQEETMLMLDSALSNIETILSACSEHQEILDQAEEVVIGCLRSVLQHKCEDLYESAFNMFQVLQLNKISPLQWQVFDWFYELFQNGFSDFFFDDCVSVLHRFITFKPEEFVTNPNRLSTTSEMLIHVMTCEDDFINESSKSAKLLECMVLEYRDGMKPFIPKILETTLNRFCKAEESETEFRTMCLQLISACLFVAPEVVLPILTSHPWPDTTLPMMDNFLKLCVQNASKLEGLHDKRIFVLMMCKLLALSPDARQGVNDELLLSLFQQSLTVLEKLPSMYTLKAKLEEDSDSENSEHNKSENGDEGMESDEDAIDEASQSYLEFLDKMIEMYAQKKTVTTRNAKDAEGRGNEFDENGDMPGKEDEEEEELTELEAYETILDKSEHDREEFVVFYETMACMEQNNRQTYEGLLNSISDAQKKLL